MKCELTAEHDLEALNDWETAMPTADACWPERLIRTKKGIIRPIIANALIALRDAPDWSGVLAFDEFAAQIRTERATPWGKPLGEQWTDNDDRRAAEWLQHQGIHVTSNLAGEAIQVVAGETRRHPVRGYLQGLVWDQIPRLDRWVTSYLGADSEIARTFGRCWLISAVARIMKPGCKVDTCMVLEGPQGLLKSTALRILGQPWFTDQIADLTSKDSVMQCHGVWIIELAELDSLSKAESSRIKAFMSATFDRFRPPYGKNVVNWPRGCVFAGSVNHDEYLRDESGARRFWPIKCGRIDIDALARDRDNLWAEAMVQYNGGAKWWLTDERTIDAAEAEQADRYQPGQWDHLIAEWVNNPQRRSEAGGTSMPMTSDRQWVTVADILFHCIGKEPRLWNRRDEMDVSAALKHQGWQRCRKPKQVADDVEAEAEEVGTKAVKVGTESDEVGPTRPWGYRRRPDKRKLS